MREWEALTKIGLPKTEGAFRYVKLREFYRQEPPLSDNLPRFDVSEGVDVGDSSHPFVRQRMARELTEERDPFALLNLEMAAPLFFYIPPGKQETITLDAYARIYIFVGHGAEVSLTVRTRQAEGWHNGVIDIVLDEQAGMTLYQYSQPGEQTWSFEAVRVTLKRASRLKCVTTMQGSVTTRHDYRVTMAGEGAEAALYGLWDLDEKRHAHVHVLVDHQEPSCQSFQHFKGLLDGTSRSSFEGKILVRQKGQQTQAYQTNHNILLSPAAQAYSKPNLEILADDVKASHGATVGKLDEEQLFYLKTRGLSKEKARRLLIEGFSAEILQHLPDAHAHTS